MNISVKIFIQLKIIQKNLMLKKFFKEIQKNIF